MIFTNMDHTELTRRLVEIGKEHGVKLIQCKPVKNGKTPAGGVYSYVDDLFKRDELLSWIDIEYLSADSTRYEITWKSYYKAMHVYYLGGDFVTVYLGKNYDATSDQFLTQVVENIDTSLKSFLTIKTLDSVDDALNDFDSIDFGEL